MKKRYILTFPPESVEEPVTYHLVKDYDIKINILNADISTGSEGFLLLEMESENNNIKSGVDFLESCGIRCESVEKRVVHHVERCIDCGACTAVCFSGALVIHPVDWKLTFDTEKCTVCELCIKACPLQLFEIDF